MRTCMALAVVWLGLLAPVTVAATVTQYTNFDAWAGAVNNQFDREDFDDDVLVGGLGVRTDFYSISNGFFYNSVNIPEFGAVWDLGRPTYGFGGSFDLSPGGIGQNLRFVVTPISGDYETVFPAPALGLQNPFFGFVTDFEFRYVLVTGGTGTVHENPGGAQETYFMDFLVFNGKKTPGGGGQVPEPGTYLLAGAGLLLLALRKRR